MASTVSISRGRPAAEVRQFACRKGRGRFPVPRRPSLLRPRWLLRHVFNRSSQLYEPVVAADASVIRVPLLTPRIAVDVVPAQLPEAGLVTLRELKPVHPLRRFPEVEMRHE
jgi:hypothetical protein